MTTSSEIIEPVSPATVTTPVSQSNAAPETHLPDEHITVIEARSGWRVLDLPEMWRYHELLGSLIWRDVQVRYKQTILGATWAIIQPLAQMLVFMVFFGQMAEVPGSQSKYPLFAFAGLLPWTFFSNAVANAANSVVNNQNLISKVYFPRLFIPGSAVGVSLVDLAVGFLAMPILLLYFQVPATWNWLWIPGLIGGMALAAFGVGTLLAALTVAYRDFRHVIPFLVQLWMFATPTVFMDTTNMGERWAKVLPLNPMYGLILNFRYAIMGRDFNHYALGVSLLSTLFLFLLGCFYFRRVERTFADII